MSDITLKEKERRTQQSVNAKQEYLRAKDVAALASIGLSSVWALRAKGLITAYKLSDKVTVFRRDEIIAYIESKREVA